MRADMAYDQMRRYLEKANKDREDAMKVKVEADLKSVIQSQDQWERKAKLLQKELDMRNDKVADLLQRNLNLEEETQRLKVEVEVEHFPTEVKSQRHESSNMAYIHSFENTIRAVH